MKAISTGGLEVVVKTLGRPTHGRVLSSFRCCKIQNFVKRDPCVNAHPAKLRRYMNDFVTGVPRRLSRSKRDLANFPSRIHGRVPEITILAHHSFKNHE